MFLGVGVAAYSAGIFHLMTHAFFKALLFLAAGSVIHGMGGEQDLRKMGGLWKKLPITFWTMTAAVFAISGAPFLSAFYSKDAILYAAFQQGTFGKVLWAVGLFTAALTAFYMFRLWYLAFFGKQRAPELHPHESPWSMLGPLVILALLSIGGGWIGIEKFGEWLAPVVGTHTVEAAGGIPEWAFSVIAVAAGFIGWLIAHLLYRPGSKAIENINAQPTDFAKVLVNKYYVDEIYNALFVKPLLMLSRFVLEWVVDFAIIGGAVLLLGGIATLTGAILQKWQSGNLRSYAAWLAAGAAALLLFALVPWSTVLANIGIHLNMIQSGAGR
jgi:NADH-quinone oxidoreductase subunit L